MLKSNPLICKFLPSSIKFLLCSTCSRQQILQAASNRGEPARHHELRPRRFARCHPPTFPCQSRRVGGNGDVMRRVFYLTGDVENQVELEEKTRLINQVLELQHTLEGNTHTQSCDIIKVDVKPGVFVPSPSRRPVGARRRRQGGEPEVEVGEPGSGSVHREPHVGVERVPGHRHQGQTEIIPPPRRRNLSGIYPKGRGGREGGGGCFLSCVMLLI